MTRGPRPFLKWAGSKQALLTHLKPHLPRQFGRYFEPFLGGGALFFHLQPARATLGDFGRELVDAYRSVQVNPAAIIEHLSSLSVSREQFYSIRDNRSSDTVVRAAELIYLNKTCWNGLYRVNSSGKFNVPYGRPGNVNVCDKDNIVACSNALNKSGVLLKQGDFEETLKGARSGDFVYLDPPYVTSHNNNGFRDWNEKLFRWDDQVRLAKVAERLRQRGVTVTISNADHVDIINLYGNFTVNRIERSSTLSSNPKHRGRVTEVILTS